MALRENRFVADANAAVSFKLIRCPGDIIDTNNAFHPDFSHQFFGENESIYGYSDLRVKLYYSACTLDVYFGIAYDEKITAAGGDSVPADDIAATITKHLPPGFLTNSDALVSCLSKQKDFRPFGHLLHSYDVTKGDEKRTFEIYKVDRATPAFISHYERMQTFAMWYIDAASYIDTDDPLWKFYVMYEKFRDDDGNVCFAFCGYSSVYHYYAYPENVRPRIGHILVLPPFQKCGHGFQLLQAINNDLICDPKVVDITAEDPSDNFIFLRDFVDSTNCALLLTFQPSALRGGFCNEMVAEARKKLKMSKRQTRRVYEILRLKHLRANDPEEFKQFRLEVKRRLFAPYQKDKRDWVKLRRALNDDEMAATSAVQLTPEDRMRSLQNQFEDVLDTYRVTLNKLAMKYETPALHLRAENGDSATSLNGTNGHN